MRRFLRPVGLVPVHSNRFRLILLVALLTLLATGLPTAMATPAFQSSSTSTATALAAGLYHTCALTTVGGVKCWGENSSGELGDDTGISSTIPVDVKGLSSGVIAITANYLHTCALTSSGGVQCWGRNTSGELGDNTTTQRNAPVPVTGLSSGVVSIAAGIYHTCAIMSGGGVKCWGENVYGQLGNDTVVGISPMPVDVTGLSSGATALTAAYDTCAVVNGGAKCWGDNSTGQLGDGTLTQRRLPVDVSGLNSGVTKIAAESFHTCAVVSSGAVKCWGDNSYGELGDGSGLSSLTPVDVSVLNTGTTAISANSRYTCSLTNGGMKCWGDNTYGQVGDGTTVQRPIPIDVNSLNNGVTSIATGDYHACAIVIGGVKCWGRNNSGQLGDGTTTQSILPVYVSGFNVAPTLEYFALGDSIAAGHGLTDNRDQPCRQSILSYPYTVLGSLQTRYSAVSFYHFACSGATTQKPDWNKLIKQHQYDRHKWLKYQVDDVIKVLSDPNRPKGRQAIVSITIGIDDYPWTNIVEMIKLLKINGDRTFQLKIDQIVIDTVDIIRNQASRLLNFENTSLVITEYYNPFNVDSHFFFKVGRLGCGTIGLSSCYDRTRYGIETLNSELKGAVFVPLNARYPGRISMTQGIYDEFIGRIGGTFLHSHDSPAPECGIAPPGIDATWMQYPSDEKSYSFPGELVPLAVRIESGVDVWRGDCVHPNKYGVASYAKYVDQALQSIAR